MPNPISPSTASTARASAALSASLPRSRRPRGASSANGTTTPALTFTPRPAISAHTPARRRDSWRAPAASPAVSASARACDQPDGAEAREHRESLQRPQSARHAERCHHVAHQREQRAIGRVFEGPADVPEDRVGRRLRGRMRVGVQPMHHAQAREAEVAEHVLGDQRRTQQQDQMGEDDGGRERAQRERACTEQHQHIAAAHQQRQALKAARREAHAEPAQRARQPVRPAADAAGDVQRRGARGARAQQEARDEHTKQSERARDARGEQGGVARRGGRALGKRCPRQGSRGLDRAIVTPVRPAVVQRAR